MNEKEVINMLYSISNESVKQFANDLKARFKAKLTFNNQIFLCDHDWISYAYIEQIIDETLHQVIPTEEEIKKMEE